MRPMLMTALSACIGLFPAALSTVIGSQVLRPLAIVVVGGMLIRPVVLLVVVPPCKRFSCAAARIKPARRGKRRLRRYRTASRTAEVPSQH
jgi:heavy metal efflux system protein